MKFDIARAWKDESYRQGLDDTQINELPANPAGELSDMELSAISGAWGTGFGAGFGFGGFGGGCGLGSCTDVHASSTALICEVNLFTVNANVLAIPIQLLSGANSNCVGSH